MDETIFASVYLGDARLAAHATSANPVWLWSADGSRILWANPAACAALSAKSPQDLLARPFAIGHPARAHIERIAGGLPPGGGIRLFRLRGFAGAAWSSLTCSCARFDFGRTTGVLVMATEPAGTEMPLAEQVRRLGFAADEAVAAYAADGTPLFATAAAEQRLGGSKTLAALDIAALASDALTAGAARGSSTAGPVVLQRIGRGPSTVLLVALPRPAAAAPPVMAAPAEIAVRRRHSLRFIWQMDAAGRFFIDSEEFADLIDAGAGQISGRLWPELNAELGLDPQQRVAAAVASRETWSNLAVSWPTSTGERLEVELAGLPTFDRNRSFRGYRGFGVCRDVLQIEELAALQPRLAETPAPPAAMLPPAAIPPSRPPDMIPSAPVSPAAPQPAAEWPTTGPSPIAPNVVRFPGVAADLRAADGDLSSGEHGAFHELARQLSARLQAADFGPERPLPGMPADLSGTAPSGRLAPAVLVPARGGAAASDDARPAFAADDRALLDRLPIGIVVYRYEEMLFANRTLLGWAGYPDLPALQTEGDLDALFPDDGLGALMEAGDSGAQIVVTTRDGDRVPVEGRLFPVFWEGSSAFAAMVLRTGAQDRIRSLEAALARTETVARELGRLLDRVEDAVLVIDADGTIVSAHGGGQAFFGRRILEGGAFESLFEPQSRAAAAAHVAGVRHEGRTVIAAHMLLGASGELRPMTVTIAPAAAASEQLTVVLRAAAAAKPEPGKTGAPDPAALDAAAALGRLCHDARSPINAITGFCDLMLEETFGPVGSARYREYIRDIKASGSEVMLRLVAAAELAEIMAGPGRLSPVRVSLNEIAQLCVAERQESASEARVVIRTALSPAVQPILADAAAVRSMIDNLLGHALQTTPAGGQVIVSTGRSPGGDAMVRIRDSGEGLNEKAIAAALQAAAPRDADRWDASTWDAGAHGAGLALVKALAHANHAHFTITSKPNQGSLFELVFTAKPERPTHEPAAPPGSSVEPPSPHLTALEISSEQRTPRPVDGAR